MHSEFRIRLAQGIPSLSDLPSGGHTQRPGRSCFGPDEPCTNSRRPARAQPPGKNSIPVRRRLGDGPRHAALRDFHRPHTSSQPSGGPKTIHRGGIRVDRGRGNYTMIESQPIGRANVPKTEEIRMPPPGNDRISAAGGRGPFLGDRTSGGTKFGVSKFKSRRLHNDA